MVFGLVTDITFLSKNVNPDGRIMGRSKHLESTFDASTMDAMDEDVEDDKGYVSGTRSEKFVKS